MKLKRSGLTSMRMRRSIENAKKKLFSAAAFEHILPKSRTRLPVTCVRDLITTASHGPPFSIFTCLPSTARSAQTGQIELLFRGLTQYGFQMAPSSPHALLQVLQLYNGTHVLRIHVDPALRSDALTVSLKCSADPSHLTVTLSFSIENVARTHRIQFSGVSLNDHPSSYGNNAFNKASSLDVPIKLDWTDQTPAIPAFAKANLTSFPLICRSCQSVLADARPEYTVECEDSEALMEAASGCCRNPHGAKHAECGELAAIKRTADPCQGHKLIEVDNGCPVVGEEYLNPNTVTLDGSIIKCNSCKTVIGRKRGLTGQFEFEPLLADFNGGKIMSMFASAFHYFSTRLVDPESHSYTTVCDYSGNPHILIGNHSFRTAAIVEGTVDSDRMADVSFSCLYTLQSDMVEKGFGTRVYFPDSIVERLKTSFSENNETLKPFRLNVGTWKFSLIALH
uniref:E3 ubiquitin-protein ligase E3D n=1 Tax=Panagrellus redivivus TaxID=6233 RepID=A0A7E4ZWF7_PANRE